MPTLLFRSPSDPAGRWRQALQAQMPELQVRVWPDTGPPEEVDYALIWASPDDMLHRLPNLRVVFSLGAGVDHLMGPEVPDHLPLVRMVDPALTEGMVEYVVYQVLRHHRHMATYERQQQAREWTVHEQTRPGDRRVGILGLGQLGSACAGALHGLGFDVAGHVRTRRSSDSPVTVFTGAEEFEAFLARSDILVCLLPLTAETRGILNRDTFARLPSGAVLINAARGAHVVEDDLLLALGEGRLAHAVLDAFETEPLPAGHPFWTHPHISVTPHVASLTNPATGAAHVVAGIRADLAGEPLPNLVDRGRGY
ncbi:MAG: glyoxylate/hydroxypyruvate reductase A [Halofilum sp. (in: g-proteobacteria)]|nr:glyoxylate/hydroxypyruvate reductase A [Halofilum sp. (in: g-proteobacteria)]